MAEFQYEPDEWLYVETSSPERARAFFGLPADTECRLDHESEDGRKVFAVRAQGFRAAVEEPKGH